MTSPVEQIKERLGIEEVVSSYLKLENAGANFKAKCPFHNEKTASFFVSPSRGNYYCFGCSASGDIFTFVEEFEGLDFKGALQLLANRAGVNLDNFSKEKEGEKEKIYRAMEDSTKFFEDNLGKTRDVLAYLESRGLKQDSVKNFRVGYVPLEWRLLYSHLKKLGHEDSTIEEAGLAKKTEKGYYDRFRGRIMFPISDTSGRIIAFSGRLYEEDEKSAKYLNSPDTPIFNKSRVLYGLDKAKDSIRKNGFSILVEGQMDLILSHQAGFRNTVATSGTALSDETLRREQVVSNLGLVRRLGGNIVLAFDADKAGDSATLRAGKIALALGMDVKVANLPLGMDPADLISKKGVDSWREAIRGSKHLIEFLLSRVLLHSKNDGRIAGRAIKEQVLPFVASIESTIEKMHFIKYISDQTSIPEEAFKEDLKQVEKEIKDELKEVEEIRNSGPEMFRKDYIERKLLGIIFWQQSTADKEIKVEETTEKLAKILNTNPDTLLSKFIQEKDDLIFEAEIFYGGGVDLEKDTRELLSNLEEEYLNIELGELMKNLKKTEESKDQEKSKELLRRISEINSKIQNIKNSRAKLK